MDTKERRRPQIGRSSGKTQGKVPGKRPIERKSAPPRPAQQRPAEQIPMPKRPGDKRRPADTVQRPGPQQGRKVGSGKPSRRPAPARKPAPPRNVQKPVHRKRPNRPVVVYTDPKPFNGRKLLLGLLTAAAIVMAVLFGMSIFFKVNLEKAIVSGNQKYTVRDVIEASGLRDGSNLLTLSDAQLSGSIKARLPYVNRVRVGIKLPDMVHIEIEELSVPYSVEADDGSWWLISADGRVVETIPMSEAKTYTQLWGLKLKEPKPGETAVASDPEQKPAETVPEETQTQETQTDETQPSQEQPSAEPSTEPAPTLAPESVAVRGSDYLSAALSVLQDLENNGILGEVASVNVTDLGAIELWYGKQYQVSLGSMDRMPYKISLLKAAVKQMGQHQSGQLDISFKIWPDQVGYTPFS